MVLAVSAYSGTSAGQVLEETIVTATHREVSAQDTSLALQVLDADLLQEAGVVQMRDLTALIPGFSVGARGSYAQIYVRGVGAFVTTSQDTSPVSINLDDVYLSSHAGVSGLFFDIERLEMLKGPQGTLYGRNNTAGTMNIITRKPDFDGVNGYMEVAVGNYDARRVDGAVNVPVSDTLALRGSIRMVNRDGYFSDDSGDDEAESGRLHALFLPNDQVSLLVSADYTHTGGLGEGYTLNPRLPGDDYAGLRDPRVEAIVQEDIPGIKPIETPFQDNENYGISAKLTWETDFGTLDVIPAWRKTTINFKTAGSGSNYTVDSDEPATSFEVRFASDYQERLHWLGGAYYYKNKRKVASEFSDFGTAFQTQNSIYDYTFESYAAFADATFDITEKWRVVGGVRYTDETVDLQGTVDVIRRDIQAPLRAYSGELDFDDTSWRAGLEYDFAQDVMVYFMASSGFKAGGVTANAPPDGTALNPFDNVYDPETITAYQLGIKSTLLDGQLRFNLEGFVWEYEDQQLNQNGPINPVPSVGRVITNVPDSPDIYGAEMSVAWQITDVDLLTADAAYLHAEYNELKLIGSRRSTSDTTGCDIGPSPVAGTLELDCSGFPLIRSPEWAGTVGYQRTFNLANSGTIYAGIRTQFSSSYFTGIDFLPSQKQDSYTNTSVDLSYTEPSGRWSIAAFARNLEDDDVATASRRNSFGTIVYDVLNAPLTYGVRGRIEF